MCVLVVVGAWAVVGVWVLGVGGFVSGLMMGGVR